METNNQPLFLWRVENYPKPPDGYNLYAKIVTCNYCDTAISTSFSSLHEYHSSGLRDIKCEFCGWKSFWSWEDDDGETFWRFEYQRIIKQIYDLNSPELLHEELGKYLLTHYKQIEYLTPRNFELLVADIFRNHGYRAVTTLATRDGGKDVILFDNQQNQLFVEVKKYTGNVGVNFIRELLGVQLIRGVAEAKLVTSSGFTTDAKKEAAMNNQRNNGYTLELLDATDLLRLLKVYEHNNTLVDELKIRKFL